MAKRTQDEVTDEQRAEGARMTEMRKAAGFKRAKHAATATGLTPGWISMIESGRVDAPLSLPLLYQALIRVRELEEPAAEEPFQIPSTEIWIDAECLEAFNLKYGKSFDASGSLKWAYLEIFAAGWSAS